MNNPLIAKYEEIYGKKEELKELRDTSTIPCVPPQSVATSNTGITAANPYISKLTSYDNESLNDSFLQIAEKVKNKQAQIYSMNMEIDQQTRTQRITFEVLTNF